MNQDQSAESIAWPHQFSDHGNEVDGGEDDFTNFLDLDTDFSNLEGLDDGHSGLDTPMGRLGFGQYNINMHNGLNMDLTTGNNMQLMDAMMSQTSAPDNRLPSHALPTYEHVHMMDQQQYQIPLTPASADIHGAKYVPATFQNNQPMYNRTSFTPLVSPAQTPLDTGLPVPEYVVSNEFFSPLNSPAINAQHVPGANAESLTPSESTNEASKRSGTTGKRGRRKESTSTRPPARSVRQSPAMKPRSRRRPLSVTTVPPELFEAMHSGAKMESDAKQGAVPMQASDSSVSPEPLLDVLMPPPAMPRSSGRSPQASGLIQGSGNIPVTPSTLMRLSSQIQSPRRPAGTMPPPGKDAAIDEISLPDSLLPSHLSIDTNVGDGTDHGMTPTISAKAAKVSASSTPRTSAANPQASTPMESNIPKRPESKAGERNSKKRPGTTSATISPALRPKMSPSISPLIPAPGPGMQSMLAETSALYLASKSNYQNILEGTHLPGVSYPEALAENLSSKRTSHKIAEQGRRNRINTALKEIEALLPQSVVITGKKERTSSNDNEDMETTSSSAQSASKANTVEMAAVYIRSLHTELNALKQRLAAAEERLKDASSGESQSSE